MEILIRRRRQLRRYHQVLQLLPLLLRQLTLLHLLCYAELRYRPYVPLLTQPVKQIVVASVQVQTTSQPSEPPHLRVTRYQRERPLLHLEKPDLPVVGLPRYDQNSIFVVVLDERTDGGRWRSRKLDLPKRGNQLV